MNKHVVVQNRLGHRYCEALKTSVNDSRESKQDVIRNARVRMVVNVGLRCFQFCSLWRSSCECWENGSIIFSWRSAWRAADRRNYELDGPRSRSAPDSISRTIKAT